MKKYKFIAFIVLAALTVTGCSKKKSYTNVNATYVESPALPSQDELQNIAKNDKSTGKIDVDLTKMSSTMIYSYIFDMLMDAESYKEKTIKVKGFFQVFVNDNSDDMYYAIIIPDAAACCQQGIEFIWAGEHEYPDDYPQLGQEITVTGKYKIFITKEGIQYSYLQVNQMDFEAI